MSGILFRVRAGHSRGDLLRDSHSKIHGAWGCPNDPMASVREPLAVSRLLFSMLTKCLGDNWYGIAGGLVFSKCKFKKFFSIFKETDVMVEFDDLHERERSHLMVKGYVHIVQGIVRVTRRSLIDEIRFDHNRKFHFTSHSVPSVWIPQLLFGKDQGTESLK